MSEQSGELRDFVYLDDQSVNNHLASLGVGIARSSNRRRLTNAKGLAASRRNCRSRAAVVSVASLPAGIDDQKRSS